MASRNLQDCTRSMVHVRSQATPRLHRPPISSSVVKIAQRLIKLEDVQCIKERERGTLTATVRPRKMSREATRFDLFWNFPFLRFSSSSVISDIGGGSSMERGGQWTSPLSCWALAILMVMKRRFEL